MAVGDGRVVKRPRRVVTGTAGVAVRREEDYTLSLEQRIAAAELRLGTAEFGSRTPNGPAGGALSGTYPNPTLAGRGAGLWSPDAPNPTPNAADQEFDGIAIPAGWTKMDVNAELTDTYADGFAKFSTPSNATARLRGIYRAAPAGSDWGIWCKVGVTGVPGTSYQAGLMLAEDASQPTLKKFVTMGLQANTGQVFQAQADTWTTYNSGAAAIGTYPAWLGGYVYLGYTGAVFNFFASIDGVSWNRVATTAAGFAPAHAGVFIMNASGLTVQSFIDFYRVRTDVGSSLINFGLTRGARL